MRAGKPRTGVGDEAEVRQDHGAEVGPPQLRQAHQQHVGGLNVAVGEARSVQGGQAAQPPLRERPQLGTSTRRHEPPGVQL